MSVEREARKALRRMLFWRLVGECFILPQVLLSGLQALVGGIGRWFKNLELAFFTMELDAARRYQLLTNLDLGRAMGDGGRYAGLRPEVQDAEPSEYFAEDDDE